MLMNLIQYRNKSLILLFEYIQSEADESQNYLPWLNKTSLVDVSHTIRELKPIQNYSRQIINCSCQVISMRQNHFM